MSGIGSGKAGASPTLQTRLYACQLEQDISSATSLLFRSPRDPCNGGRLHQPKWILLIPREISALVVYFCQRPSHPCTVYCLPAYTVYCRPVSSGRSERKYSGARQRADPQVVFLAATSVSKARKL
jgi:hypothetical protein